MDCKLIDCDAEATVRVIHPYGTANVCDPHAAGLDDCDPETTKALLKVMRYGPREDPPLENEDRGAPWPEGEYPAFVRRGPVTDVRAAFDGCNDACFCVHGKYWRERDLYEENGGKACAECSQASLALITGP